MQVETNQEGASFCYSNLHANCPDSPNGTEAKRFQYYVCLKPKEAKDARKIQKIALYRQILLEIFAALIFSIIKNKSRLFSFYRNKQSKTDTSQVSTFDCRIFESR